MTVLRRLGPVLETTQWAVLDMKASLDAVGVGISPDWADVALGSLIEKLT